MLKQYIFILLMLTCSLLAGGKIMIFGGSGHDVYLGCLNCSEYDSDSVFNEYGTYGNEYSTDSIFNEYGQYGGEYSSYSPCNEYSTTPPVVVDKDGNFYGYLTINEYMPKAISDENIVNWLKYKVCKK